MSDFKLYELTEMYKRLTRQALEADDDDSIKAFQDTFESLDTAINDKFQGCAAIIEKLTYKANVLKEEAKWRAAKARTIENNIKRLKEYMKNNMEELNITEVEAGQWDIKIAKNGGLPKVNVLIPIEELPDEYKKVEYKTNTEALLKAAGKKEGEVVKVDGREIAWLQPRGTSLRIK